MEFKAVIELAEAAEKYHVYSAVHVCRLCLRYSGYVPLSLPTITSSPELNGLPRNFIMKHPVEIALFAAKHGYSDLLELTGAHGALLPLSTVAALLPQHLIVPWVRIASKLYKPTP
jgi:hypothetical protein